MAGAQASARLYSLVQCAKVNGLEPYAYLRRVFTDLPRAQSLGDIEALLPTRITPTDLDLNFTLRAVFLPASAMTPFPGRLLKTRLRRTNKSTCADRLISRLDAHFEPLERAMRREDSLLIGEWYGVWRNGVIDELQITDIGSWGVTRGVFCELIWNGAAFRFWDLHDRRIGARRTRKGDKQIVTWTRKPARWALRHKKKYRFEVVPSGDGASRVVQSWRYRAKKNKLTMARGSIGARGCLSRIRPTTGPGRSAHGPAQTENQDRGGR